MGIKLDPVRVDKQGFPVVTWTEDRNMFSPEGIGKAKVACFVAPDNNGVLQFVKVGTAQAWGLSGSATPGMRLALAGIGVGGEAL